MPYTSSSFALVMTRQNYTFELFRNCQAFYLLFLGQGGAWCSWLPYAIVFTI